MVEETRVKQLEAEALELQRQIRSKYPMIVPEPWPEELKRLQSRLWELGYEIIGEKAKERSKTSEGTDLVDWLPEIEGSPGIVVDEAVAKATPCTVYKVDTTEMAFSRGIIGTLSKGQIEAYCPTKIYKTEGIARRVKTFKEIAKQCSEEVREKYEKGERLIPYLKCMGKLAKEKGIEL